MKPEKTIYLDHNASNPVYPEVLEEVVRVTRDVYANPSSPHRPGKLARAIVEDSREKIASLLRVRSEEIIFTSGATESNNLAIKGVAGCHHGQRHIITTLTEHPAVYRVIEYLEELGHTATFLGTDNKGFVDPEAFGSNVRENTCMFSCIYANNETGTIQDIPAIGAIARKTGIPLHTDAVQAFGKIPLDPEKENISLLSVSGHKIGAPKGTGLLYRSRDLDRELTPLIHGGGQEASLRSGTENVPGIAGLAMAAEMRYKTMEKETESMKKLTELFVSLVREKFSYLVINSPENRLAHTLNLRFPGLSGPKIISCLNDRGICASPSSACSSNSAKPSKVLTAMGLMPDEAFSSVRFSFSPDMNEETVRKAAFELTEVLTELND